MRIFVRASNLRWPELFGQGPGAVRQGRTNCELGVARVTPRIGTVLFSVCVWNEAVVLDIF
jgi:hypothetical protein